MRLDSYLFYSLTLKCAAFPRLCKFVDLDPPQEVTSFSERVSDRKTSDKAIPEKRKKSCYTYFTKQALPFLSRKSIFCDYVPIWVSIQACSDLY